MKRLLALVFTLLLTFSLAACGSKTYDVTTRSGETFTTKGAPDYNVKTKIYKFKDKNGKEIILNQDEIEIIKEK